MKRFILSCILLLFSVNLLLATGQRSELILLDGDTLDLLTEPLESYLSQHEPRKQYYPWLETGCSTALWRGYVALWKLEDNQLILLDVYPCGRKDESMKESIFPDQDRVVANWYSGQLNIQHGKMIKYFHSGYDRYYEEETVVTIDHGQVITQQHFVNGTQSNDLGFSNSPDTIMNEVYRRINWKNIPARSKGKKLYVRLKTGKTDSLVIVGNLFGIYREELQKAIGGFPQLKKFYYRGQPLKREYVLPIFFSRQHRRKYAR